MGLFDEITSTVVNAGQVVGDKVKTAVDMTKATYEVKDTEHKLRDAYAELGRRYYQEHSEDSEEDFTEIEALLEKLEEKKETVEVLKKTQNCPTCGASVSKESAFCPKCGEKMPVSNTEEVNTEDKTAPTAEPDAFVDEEPEGTVSEPRQHFQEETVPGEISAEAPKEAVAKESQDMPVYEENSEDKPVEEFKYGE